MARKAPKKTPSFRSGTTARKARGKIAEEFKATGDSADTAFAKATAITQRASPGGRKRLAQHGITKPKAKKRTKKAAA